MARVEIRTDEGGHPLELDIANLALRELVLLRLYGDPEYGRAFRYDAEDIARARRNERRAAERGLCAEIEDPFSGKPLPMRQFLQRTLADSLPLAEAFEMHALLTPLQEMASGAPNTAERLRARLQAELGDRDVVPAELLRLLAEEREQQVAADIERIAAALPALGQEATRLRELWGRARDHARREPSAPIRFRPAAGATVGVHYPDKASEIIDLARELIRIPSVSVAIPGGQRLDEVRRAATFIFDYLRQAGLEVRSFEAGPYPALLARFPGQASPPVLLCGHYDVVEPEPGDGQFEPRLDGDYLCGRGACDMKTAVATYLVWMKDVRHRGGPYPGIGLLLVGNEETGESEPSGTPHVLRELEQEGTPMPRLLIAGERTGERGDEKFGSICTHNRGLMRLELRLRGQRGHTGFAGPGQDLSARLFEARADLLHRLSPRAHLEGNGPWRTTVSFPFVRLGEPGLFNITAEEGVLGLEVRPIPEDEIDLLLREIHAYCHEAHIEVHLTAAENGIACDPNNPFLQRLIGAVRQVSGAEPSIGRKLAATSARFAPGGQGVVWGQSGVGPHAADERHFLPSVDPYYQVLDVFAQGLIETTPHLVTEEER